MARASPPPPRPRRPGDGGPAASWEGPGSGPAVARDPVRPRRLRGRWSRAGPCGGGGAFGAAAPSAGPPGRSGPGRAGPGPSVRSAWRRAGRGEAGPASGGMTARRGARPRGAPAARGGLAGAPRAASAASVVGRALAGGRPRGKRPRPSGPGCPSRPETGRAGGPAPPGASAARPSVPALTPGRRAGPADLRGRPDGAPSAGRAPRAPEGPEAGAAARARAGEGVAPGASPAACSAGSRRHLPAVAGSHRLGFTGAVRCGRAPFPLQRVCRCAAHGVAVGGWWAPCVRVRCPLHFLPPRGPLARRPSPPPPGLAARPRAACGEGRWVGALRLPTSPAAAVGAGAVERPVSRAAGRVSSDV